MRKSRRGYMGEVSQNNSKGSWLKVLVWLAHLFLQKNSCSKSLRSFRSLIDQKTVLDCIANKKQKKTATWAVSFNSSNWNYLAAMYIVTSKPKRRSVAVGLVHIMFLLKFKFLLSRGYQKVKYSVSGKSWKNTNENH